MATAEESALRGVFAALERHAVDYAVFGAVALGLHGLGRATADVDLFIAPDVANVARLKAALRDVYEDAAIEEIASEDLLGEYPAVRYVPPAGPGLDIVTRVGTAFSFADLEIETKTFDGVPVRVVSPRTLWRMKKGTLRERDRFDARALAERFGFVEE